MNEDFECWEDLICVVEINDFGYPQNSEIDTLKTYITTESVMSTNVAAVRTFILLYARRPQYARLGGVFEDYNASNRCHQLEKK